MYVRYILELACQAPSAKIGPHLQCRPKNGDRLGLPSKAEEESARGAPSWLWAPPILWRGRAFGLSFNRLSDARPRRAAERINRLGLELIDSALGLGIKT